MRHFVPHAVILLVLVALEAGTLPEKPCLVLLLGAHLLAPIWSAALAQREKRVRAVLLGPGTIIGVHLIGLVLTLLSALGGVPEGSWITMMLVIIWAIALAVYAIYCTVAFSIVSRVRGIHR